MSLDTLPLLRLAGWNVTRRHKRNTERGHRSDDTILGWPRKLRGTPVAEELATPDPAVNGVNEGSAR